MQNTTADYKLEINKPSRSFEYKITIGNTISQSLDLTLLNREDIIYSTS